MTAPSRRRSFRFSLRTLFVLLTVLGMFLCWLGVQVKWIRDRHEALGNSRIAEADAAKDFAGLLGGGEVGRPVAPGWLMFLGERGVTSISIWMTDDEDSDRKKIAELQELFPEARIQRQY